MGRPLARAIVEAHPGDNEGKPAALCSIADDRSADPKSSEQEPLYDRAIHDAPRGGR
jgi:hypothetical protein